jgi:ubiquinone biosynthesis monooxygenase Coq7
VNSLLDRFIEELDTALRVVTTKARSRPADMPCSPELSEQGADDGISSAERAQSARLMRVNHAGEIAAQALYRGQAFVTRDAAMRAKLLAAAAEEHSHLLWCDHRVRALGAHTSRLGPVWYGGSFLIGALAGMSGDRISLGFLAETEDQVTAHLEDHLSRLPRNDVRSREILEKMREDERAHQDAAVRAGGAALPAPAKRAMQGIAGFMTGVAYWI